MVILSDKKRKIQFILYIFLLACALIYACGQNTKSSGWDENQANENDLDEIEEEQNPQGDICGDIRLLGPAFSDLSSTGNANPNYWKAVRNLAEQNGVPSCFKVEVIDYMGDRSSDTIKYAIYSDNNGEVGQLLFAGKWEGYDWTDIGAGIHQFPIEAVSSSEQLFENAYYWIAVYSSAGEELWFSRSGGSPDPMMPRRAAKSTGDQPGGDEFNIHLDDGSYGWSLW